MFCRVFNPGVHAVHNIICTGITCFYSAWNICNMYTVINPSEKINKNNGRTCWFRNIKECIQKIVRRKNKNPKKNRGNASGIWFHFKVGHGWCKLYLIKEKRASCNNDLTKLQKIKSPQRIQTAEVRIVCWRRS